MLDIHKKSVLINSLDGDFHAAVFEQALSKRGSRVIRWNAEDYPTKSSVSIKYEEGRAHVRISTKEHQFNEDDIRVVWNRRRCLPEVPKIIDGRDRQFVKMELDAAYHAHKSLFRDAFWINKGISADASDLKIHQLLVAQAVGLFIPRTLISNNPEEIRAFIECAGGHIYKPLTGYVWQEQGSVIQTFTAKVTAELMPENSLLAATPGIFQAKVPKKYEARVQFFGRFYGGVRIESHRLGGGDLDWRIGQGDIKACAPAVLPEEIYEKC
ncbi:MvdC/MvdD family ATP grasp protein, partial [Xanthomonas citri]